VMTPTPCPPSHAPAGGVPGVEGGEVHEAVCAGHEEGVAAGQHHQGVRLQLAVCNLAQRPARPPRVHRLPRSMQGRVSTDHTAAKVVPTYWATCTHPPQLQLPTQIMLQHCKLPRCPSHHSATPKRTRQPAPPKLLLLHWPAFQPQLLWRRCIGESWQVPSVKGDLWCHATHLVEDAAGGPGAAVGVGAEGGVGAGLPAHPGAAVAARQLLVAPLIARQPAANAQAARQRPASRSSSCGTQSHACMPADRPQHRAVHPSCARRGAACDPDCRRCRGCCSHQLGGMAVVYPPCPGTQPSHEPCPSSAARAVPSWTPAAIYIHIGCATSAPECTNCCRTLLSTTKRFACVAPSRQHAANCFRSLPALKFAVCHR
jgi:hypothetical protein